MALRTLIGHVVILEVAPGPPGPPLAAPLIKDCMVLVTGGGKECVRGVAQGEEGTTEAGGKERTGTRERDPDGDEETIEERGGKSLQEVSIHLYCS